LAPIINFKSFIHVTITSKKVLPLDLENVYYYMG